MKLFSDRYDAGAHLAKKLQIFKDTDSIVLALPRGGVPVGHGIAVALRLPLDVVITHRIAHPYNTDVAICAITEDGKRVCDDYGLYGVDQSWIDHESVLAMEEASRRRKIFTVRPSQSIRDKIVILVDDGIATGLTMKAALLGVRAQKPKKIILAVPVCPHLILKELKVQVEDVVVLNDEAHFRGAISAYYRFFPEIADTEIISCLKDAPGIQKSMIMLEYENI
jgi:predicted phosphoribosyltransferase